LTDSYYNLHSLVHQSYKTSSLVEFWQVSLYRDTLQNFIFQKNTYECNLVHLTQNETHFVFCAMLN